MIGGGETGLKCDRRFRLCWGEGAEASPTILSRTRLPTMAALGFAIFFLYTAHVLGDENGSGTSHAVDANRAVVTSAPDSNSNAGNQATHSTSFDELPIRHPGDGAANGGSPVGGSSNTPVTSAPSLEAPRVLLALALVVGLIFALRWAARRFFVTPGAASGSSAVEVLSRSAFSPRQQVVLIRVGRRVLVVSDNGQQLSSLAQISEPDEVAALLGQVRERAGTSPSKAFGNLFQRFSATPDEAEEDLPPTRDPDRSETKTDVSTDPAAVAATRAELGNLMEQVRLVSRQLGRS